MYSVTVLVLVHTQHLYQTGIVKPLLQYKIDFATFLSFVTSCDWNVHHMLTRLRV